MGKKVFMFNSKYMVLIFIFTFSVLLSISSVASAATLTDHYQEVNDQVSFIQANSTLADKGNFFIRRIVSKVDHTYWTSFRIPGEAGTLKYFDDHKNLVEVAMVEGPLPQGRIIFLSTDSYHYILGQPYTYRDLGAGTKDSLLSHPIQLKKDQSGWVVTFRYSLSPGVHGILWGVGSPQDLVDFDNKDQFRLWSNYDLDKNARLLYDGYHYKNPTTYFPTSPNSYWRIPSDYLTNSMVRSGGSPASEIIGSSLLKIAHKNIGGEGFLPTLPRSNWLYEDYGIEAGFFDTRFNADTIETNIIAYKKYGDPVYRDMAIRLADYYLDHGRNNRFVLQDPTLGEGWLVEDYYHKSGRKNHTSLNHQLQAIHSFLLLYESEKNPEYLDFAQKMINGIKITRDMWIMEDGNLEYAYMPDGTMGLVDYDYLTYNDLLNVQEALARIKGQSDQDLQILMESKKLWMDRNNVSGYRITEPTTNPS
ncbi:MAG TPA: hypothetical protein VFD79_04750 [Tissierellaceae bacterium]|nr:hypothetical protein [Tissierellaceae bacterium]